jgi:hypothetical protein
MEPFEVSGQITINLPAQQVFPLATNLTNPWWQATQQTYGQTKPVISHTSGPKMGVGAVYTSIGQQTSENGTIWTMTTVLTVKEYTPPTKCMFTMHTRMAGATGGSLLNDMLENMGEPEFHISIQPSGSGGCILSTTTKKLQTYSRVKQMTITQLQPQMQMQLMSLKNAVEQQGQYAPPPQFNQPGMVMQPGLAMEQAMRIPQAVPLDPPQAGSGFCTSCGARRPEGIKFCGQCGST